MVKFIQSSFMSKRQLLVLTIRRVILSLIGVGVIAAMFWYVNTYIYKFYASTDVVTIDVTSTEDTVGVNSQFAFNVILSGPKIETVDLVMNLDPERVEFVDEIVSVPPNYFKAKVEYQKLDTATKKLRVIILPNDTTATQSNIQLILKFKA